MPNLMITTACNLRCDYCFGLDMIGPGLPWSHMDWETFVDLLGWVEAGDVPHLDIHLMGGEPTLNPLFGDMFRELRRRGRRTVVFSNGAVRIERGVVEESAGVGVEWVVNVNLPETYREAQRHVLERNLGLLGDRAALTFNITRGDMPYEHIFRAIERHGLRRMIKIGVALPTMEHSNVFVERGRFDQVGDRVMHVFESARSIGIDVEFECGVPYCLFTPAQREILDGVAISTCGSRLDITPAGEVINCLPLCGVASVPYTAFEDYGQAFRWFREALGPYNRLGAHLECVGCEDLAARRCGACLAYGLGEYNRVALPPLPGEQGACDRGHD